MYQVPMISSLWSSCELMTVTLRALRAILNMVWRAQGGTQNALGGGVPRAAKWRITFLDLALKSFCCLVQSLNLKVTKQTSVIQGVLQGDCCIMDFIYQPLIMHLFALYLKKVPISANTLQGWFGFYISIISSLSEKNIHIDTFCTNSEIRTL